jgi:hypothetical protein
MTSLITGIGCIVVVLILMIPPILFGYFVNEAINGCGCEDWGKFALTACVLEFVFLSIAFIYCVNGGVLG